MGEEGKRAAARRAARILVDEFRDARLVGVGTGSTVRMVVEEIGRIDPSFLTTKRFVASSLDTWSLLTRYGASVTLSPIPAEPDVYFDGADEVVVAEGCPCIKGRGAALYLEKLLAFHSRYSILVVDESKLSDKLGRKGRPIPLDVDPIAVQVVTRRLEEMGFKVQVRDAGGKDGPVISDTGGVILDVYAGLLEDPEQLEMLLEFIPGVKAAGIFTRMFNKIIIGYDDGRTVVKEC